MIFYSFRSIFRTPSHICDGTFLPNIVVGSYFWKGVHHRYLLWFWMSLWVQTLNKKWNFLLRIIFGHCNQICRNCGFGQIYWRTPKLKTLFFVQWNWKVPKICKYNIICAVTFGNQPKNDSIIWIISFREFLPKMKFTISLPISRCFPFTEHFFLT